MAKYITTTEDIRVRLDTVEEYGAQDENKDASYIRTRTRTHYVDLPVDSIDRLLYEEPGVFSQKDANIIERFSRKLDELMGAIGRIPTSIRMHY